MSEGMVIAAALPAPEAQSSRLEQRIRALTEQLVQVRGELRRAQERIAALATVDETTGLLNARAFRERALVEVDRATRYDRPLALVLLEPDEGASLASLAELCRTQCRTVDAVGRSEDGAIALLLPETALPGALVIAERVCAMAARRGVDAGAGCAAWPPEGGALNRLIDAARQALSMARTGGAARVRSASVERRP
jgi:PleD family two-component response regulator